MAEHGIWMPLYWGDYFGATSGLSCEEHGAYLLLIGAYWQRGRALPDDDRFLATATRNSMKKWKIMRPKIIDFFSQQDGELKHDRIEKELLNSCKRVSDGKAAAHARWMRKDMQVTTTITKKERRARAQPYTNGVDALALTPEQIAQNADKADRLMKRGKYAQKIE